MNALDGAGFIGAARWPVNEADHPAAYFRTEFTVAPDLVSATLHLTALGIVEPWLNGAPVGDEVLAPSWTSYRHRLVVRRHDVTALLRPGARNAFGAIVGEGWALGRMGFPTIERRRRFADRLALFAVLELGYPDRTVHVRTSPDAFTCGEGSVRTNSIYDGVVIDARLEPLGWSEPGFDDGAWGPCEAVEWDPGTLVEPSAPPIRRVEQLAPVKVWSSSHGTTVVDFGQNLAGWTRLRVRGPAGHEVSVRHAEVLVDELPDYETLRSAKATDTYVLAGRGEEEFEPRFTFHGFRYAELSGLPDDFSADDISAVVVHSDMVRTGWFETSDELVNRLHSNVVWSMRGNFVGLPTDCPQRDERMGWTGDINAFAPTAAYLYDVRGVLASWLADLRAEQAERGFVPYVVPDVQGSNDMPTALWSDVAVSLPWTLYQAYGDSGVLRDSYDSMVTFTRSIEERLDEHGLWSRGFQFGDWLDPDAPTKNPTAGKTEGALVATAFFAKVAREMALTAALLGHALDAGEFSRLADRVRGAFREEYVTPSGRVTNESATAYALAIQFGLLDPSELPKAGERLSHLVRRARYRISTGFAGTPLVAHALSSTGHTDDAYGLLLCTEMPSLLYPVTRGATTIWERWDSVMPDGTINPSGMTSLNHYALGGVASWLHSVVGGLQATSPGYRTMRIAPEPGGGLTHARAVLDTVHGRVVSSWELRGEEMTLEVTLPEGTTAEVCLPLHPEGERHAMGPGTQRWVYPAADPGHELRLYAAVDVLAADETTWAAVTAVLAKYLPNMPPAFMVELAPKDSLASLLDRLPGLPRDIHQEVNEAITAANPPTHAPGE